jgi:hypothetical protein
VRRCCCFSGSPASLQQTCAPQGKKNGQDLAIFVDPVRFHSVMNVAAAIVLDAQIAQQVHTNQDPECPIVLNVLGVLFQIWALWLAQIATLGLSRSAERQCALIALLANSQLHTDVPEIARIVQQENSRQR